MDSQRLHSLDAMRAFLMLLGVYFHLSLAYTTFGDDWARDLNSISPVFDNFFGTVHYFRMHAFFLIAGFFGSLLYHKRGVRKMIFNRFKRIFLPLIIFIWPVGLLSSYCERFSHARNDGQSILESLINSLSIFEVESPLELFPWYSTDHLWFLNYLFFMSLLACFLKLITPQGNIISNGIRKVISIIFLKPWIGMVVFCCSFGTLMMLLVKSMAQGDAHWWAWLWFLQWKAIKSFLAFGFFYIIGWHMYHHKDLINRLSVKRQFSILVVFATLLWGLFYGIYKVYPFSPYPQIHYSLGSLNNVTFNIDMSEFDFSQFNKEENEFRGIFIQGAFNDWCGECDNKMIDEDGDGIYTKNIQMFNGDYKFIFTINGWDGVKRDKENNFQEWISPGKEGLKCDIAPEFSEYVIQVFREDVVLDPICWKKCTDCDGNIINLTLNGKKETLKHHPINLLHIFLWNSGVPIYVMLIMALCIRFFNTGSKTMRYVSDSSYWIYIIHLPLTHFIPGLFHGVNMNVFLKFSISSILITIICLVSYHYVVRGTFIGKFLNGKKYK